MVTTVFQNIAAAASDASIVDARKWYRNQASLVKKVNAREIIDPKNVRSNIGMQNLGQMFMFFYNPKLKQSLPYYDMFPLVFPVELYSDGFLGINLHYLPRNYRAKLMDALYTTINNKKSDKSTRLRLTYDVLRSATSMRYFKPCLKRYLAGHIMQKFIYIDPENWDKALMLPTERFMKKPVFSVHRESVESLRAGP
jgi:hypothetical protein